MPVFISPSSLSSVWDLSLWITASNIQGGMTASGRCSPLWSSLTDNRLKPGLLMVSPVTTLLPYLNLSWGTCSLSRGVSPMGFPIPSSWQWGLTISWVKGMGKWMNNFMDVPSTCTSICEGLLPNIQRFPIYSFLRLCHISLLFLRWILVHPHCVHSQEIERSGCLHHFLVASTVEGAWL